MEWDEAKEKINKQIIVGLILNPRLPGRIILSGPNYICNNYDYHGSFGFKVKIGINNSIEIPFSMLQTCFEDSIANNGIFNINTFRRHFPTRAERKTGHGCHIQVIGKIFEISEIATQINNRDYQLI